MAEPGIIMTLSNLDRAQRAVDDPKKASDKELRYAIRYYRAYNRDVKLQAQNARDTRDYYEREWGDGGWSDVTERVINERKDRNSKILRALNGELRNRTNR